MAYERCSKCGFMHYLTDPCRAKAAPAKKSFVERYTEVIKQAPRTKSTAARKDVHRNSSADGSADSRSNAEKPSNAVAHPQETARPQEGAGTQAPPVETTPRGRGRPKVHPDRKAYKAGKERERRARKKTGPAPS